MKLKTETIKKGLFGFLRKLGKKLFLVLIILIFLDIALGALFFWKYYLKGPEKEIIMPPPLVINRAMLNQFTGQALEKAKIFQAADTKVYPNPFYGIPVTQPEEPVETEEETPTEE